MTTEITECLNDLNLPSSELAELASTFSEPSNSLVDLLAIHHHLIIDNLIAITQSLTVAKLTQCWRPPFHRR